MIVFQRLVCTCRSSPLLAVSFVGCLLCQWSLFSVVSFAGCLPGGRLVVLYFRLKSFGEFVRAVTFSPQFRNVFFQNGRTSYVGSHPRQ